MKKKFTLLKMMLLAVFMIGGTNAWADTYNHTFEKGSIDATGTLTLSGVEWIFENSGGYYGWDANKGIQIGSGSKPAKTMSLSTSGIQGNISSITINTSGASKIAATIAVSINGIDIESPKTITTSPADYTFTPTESASGSILISWNQNSSKALYIKSISIEYTNSTNTNDATLYTLNIDEQKIPDFDPATEIYNYEVAYSDSNIPEVSAIANSSEATLNITQATVVPGSASVVVTAEDGTTTKTYTVNFTKAAASTDATLSNILVNETSIEGFDPSTYEYTYNVAIGTSEFPSISATTTHEYATTVVTQATGSGDASAASIVVTAEDGTTILTYKVVFVEVEMNDGTKERPFTVEETIDNQGLTGHHWVIGYIVGIPKSASSLGGTGKTAIAISDNPVAAFSTSVVDWIPVQLPSEVRDALNLEDNPGNLGKQVKLYGTLEAYFSTPGIRDVSDFEILATVGVKDNELEGTVITTDGNNIVVKAEQATTINVYSISGKLVATSVLIDGSAIIPVNKGVYIVKTDNKVTKVIL